MTPVDALTPAAHLSAHGLAALVFTALVFAVFIWDRLPITTVCLAILVALPLGFALLPLHGATGAVDPMRFFAGFGHPALVAICGLMVVGHGLVVTGALEPAARWLSGWVVTRPKLALLALLGGAMAVSGLINDTPLVVLLIPLILAAAKRAGVAEGAGASAVPASVNSVATSGTMLLPMNYAVLIGGMSTTIGTSTNLIVVALAASLGVAPFGLFSFLPVVALAALPALAYLWLVAPRLLAHVQAPTEQLSESVFDAEIHVEADSWLEGRPLMEVFKATGHRLRVIELRRKGRAVLRLPTVKLQAGDQLAVQDTATNLKDFETRLQAKLHGMSPDDAPERPAPVDPDEGPLPLSAVVAQLVITPTSPLIGRTVRGERIAERFGVMVVGLRPRQAVAGWNPENLIDREVRAGDMLLLQGEDHCIRAVQHDGFGLLLDAKYTLPRQHKAGVALAVMAVVVLLAATKTLPIALAALGGVMCLLATRCLSWQDVTQALSVKVVLLVASSLALGDALDLTGATGWLAGQLAALSAGLSPAWVLALLMGLMGLLTNFVSNNAAAAIGTPLGVELARSIGAPPEPFVLAVLFGCNLCYLTPMGYQTNLLVMNAGGYRFKDFVRVGTPLFLIMWAGLSYGLNWRYGL